LRLVDLVLRRLLLREGGKEGEKDGDITSSTSSFSGREGGREGFFASRPLRFETQKESLVRSYCNENMRPSRHARTLRLHVLKEKMWKAEELEKEAATLTIEEMGRFVPVLLGEVQVDGLYQVRREGGREGGREGRKE